MKPRLFDKIGIDSENLRWELLGDIENGAGGLYSTTEDNLRLGILYLNGGLWNGERILAQDYVQQAMEKQNDTANWPDSYAADNFCGYGYQMWMCRPEKSCRMDGAGGQYVLLFPKQEMAVAIHEIIQRPDAPHHIMSAVFECLLPYLKPEAIEPDVSEAMKLKLRLDTLSFPRPWRRAIPDLARRISDKIFKVTQGNVSLRNTFAMPGLTEEMKDSWEFFSLQFNAGECRLDIWKNGQNIPVDIGIDGTSRRSRVTDKLPDIVYCSGVWLDECTFEISSRFIEEMRKKDPDEFY